MSVINEFHLWGKLISKPELKGEGKNKRLNGAISVRGRKKNEETGLNEYEVYNFTAWGAVAERMAKFTKQKCNLLISGTIRTHRQIINEQLVDEDGQFYVKSRKYDMLTLTVDDFQITDQKGMVEGDSMQQSEVSESNEGESAEFNVHRNYSYDELTVQSETGFYPDEVDLPF